MEPGPSYPEIETFTVDGRPRWLRSKSLFSLVALFIATFLLPVILFWGVGPSRESVDSSIPVVFKEPITLQTIGSHLRIADKNSLNPKAGEDFLFNVWFSLKSLPQAGERTMIFEMLEGEGQGRFGYALGLVREGRAIFPLVFWRDQDGRGGWYQFTELEIAPKRWTNLSLTFHDDHKLGVHGAVYQAQRYHRELYGGYELSAEVIPQPKSDLRIGAFKSSRFIGDLGSVTILSGKKLSAKFRSLFKQLVEYPETPPSVDENTLKLFLSAEAKDLSRFEHVIELVTVPSRRKGRGKE